MAPHVEVLGPTSLKVSWTRPINPNGLLISYTVRLPQPRFDVNVSVTSLDVTQLDAYTVYNVTLTACSGKWVTRSLNLGQYCSVIYAQTV